MRPCVVGPRRCSVRPTVTRPPLQRFALPTLQVSRRYATGVDTKPSAKDVTNAPKVSVTFLNKDGTKKQVTGHVGQHILDVAHKHGIDLEGACEASLACSTCHVILTPEYYKKLPEPSDEENDMLDLAFGLTPTSRLGCQVVLKPELEGMTLQLPVATRNMAVDGFKPKPH